MPPAGCNTEVLTEKFYLEHHTTGSKDLTWIVATRVHVYADDLEEVLTEFNVIKVSACGRVIFEAKHRAGAKLFGMAVEFASKEDARKAHAICNLRSLSSSGFDSSTQMIFLRPGDDGRLVTNTGRRAFKMSLRLGTHNTPEVYDLLRPFGDVFLVYFLEELDCHVVHLESGKAADVMIHRVSQESTTISLEPLPEDVNPLSVHDYFPSSRASRLSVPPLKRRGEVLNASSAKPASTHSRQTVLSWVLSSASTLWMYLAWQSLNISSNITAGWNILLRAFANRRNHYLDEVMATHERERAQWNTELSAAHRSIDVKTTLLTGAEALNEALTMQCENLEDNLAAVKQASASEREQLWTKLESLTEASSFLLKMREDDGGETAIPVPESVGNAGFFARFGEEIWRAYEKEMAEMEETF